MNEEKINNQSNEKNDNRLQYGGELEKGADKPEIGESGVFLCQRRSRCGPLLRQRERVAAEREKGEVKAARNERSIVLVIVCCCRCCCLCCFILFPLLSQFGPPVVGRHCERIETIIVRETAMARQLTTQAFCPLDSPIQHTISNSIEAAVESIPPLSLSPSSPQPPPSSPPPVNVINSEHYSALLSLNASVANLYSSLSSSSPSPPSPLRVPSSLPLTRHSSVLLILAHFGFTHFDSCSLDCLFDICVETVCKQARTIISGSERDRMRLLSDCSVSLGSSDSSRVAALSQRINEIQQRLANETESMEDEATNNMPDLEFM